MQVKIALQKRNSCIYEVIRNLRVRVASVTTGLLELLVNEARVLSADFIDICKQEHLRKLFFMQQVRRMCIEETFYSFEFVVRSACKTHGALAISHRWLS